jgi:hypothetical protein
VAGGQLAAGGDASVAVGAVPLAGAVDRGAVTADLVTTSLGCRQRPVMPEALRVDAAISGSRGSSDMDDGPAFLQRGV